MRSSSLASFFSVAEIPKRTRDGERFYKNRYGAAPHRARLVEKGLIEADVPGRYRSLKESEKTVATNPDLLAVARLAR
jgi:hypothetical protein